MPLVISTLQASNWDFFEIESFQFDASPPGTPSINGYPTTPVGDSLRINGHMPAGSASPMRVHGNRDNLYNGKFIARKLVPRHRLCLVGLDRDYVDAWAMKIIKIIFYQNYDHRKGECDERFFSYTTTEEGISLVAEDIVLAEFPEHFLHMSTPLKHLRCIQVDLKDYGLDKYGIVYSMAYPLSSNGINLLFLSTYVTSNILVSFSEFSFVHLVFDAYLCFR